MVRLKNTNVHRFTHNLHGLQLVMIERFPWNISAWNAIVCEKWVKQLVFIMCDKNLMFEKQKTYKVPFYYFLVTSMTNWAQTFTGLFVHANVESPKMWTPILSCYQKCIIPLKWIAPNENQRFSGPVSYTHLTLPTTVIV